MAKPVLVITGGSRGIGRAVALGAAKRGYSVCFSFLGHESAARDVEAQIEQMGGEVKAVRGDCGEPGDVEKLFTAAAGMGRLAGLVNNAGIMASGARVEDMSIDRLAEVFRVNVTGSFLCAKEAIRSMSTRHGGQGGGIVNISSAAARLGGAGEAVDYAASKGAIETFTRGLAIEVAHEGIRVNAVAPGMIETDIHARTGTPDRLRRAIPSIPLQRIGTAEEVAASVLWLLSDEAAYVTGCILTVSGGR
jgi:NAD(P)-dependent dehydrogenase (short-subunit alcohol dehydrogenase family)